MPTLLLLPLQEGNEVPLMSSWSPVEVGEIGTNGYRSSKKSKCGKQFKSAKMTKTAKASKGAKSGKGTKKAKGRTLFDARANANKRRRKRYVK